MEEDNNVNAFVAFDFTADDVTAALDEIKKATGPGKSICMCGHPEGRHEWLENMAQNVCNANKQNCNCKKKELVLEASDARVFFRKTTGPGPLHALAQGMAEAQKREQEIKWLVDVKCARCSEVGPVSPVPVNERGTVMDKDTGFNAFLCNKCRLANV